MKKKKKIILPQAEIVSFSEEDVIYTSAHTEEYADDDWGQNDGAENW